jgi:hypothetical protein
VHEHLKQTLDPIFFSLLTLVGSQIIEGNPAEFSPTRELTNDGVNKLVESSIRRLLERDSPSLETVKMQVPRS